MGDEFRKRQGRKSSFGFKKKGKVEPPHTKRTPGGGGQKKTTPPTPPRKRGATALGVLSGGKKGEEWARSRQIKNSTTSCMTEKRDLPLHKKGAKSIFLHKEGNISGGKDRELRAVRGREIVSKGGPR